MNLRSILLTLQYISIFGLFIEGWIVFRRMRDRLHGYLFLSCVAGFINNIGYLMEMLSSTEEAYITAMKLSYVGRTWFCFTMFLFVAELCHVKISRKAKNILVLIHAAVFISILSVNEHSLYYERIGFSTDGILPQYIHNNGIIHHLFTLLQVVYIVTGIYWLIKTYRAEGRKTAKKRVMAVIFAVIAEAGFYAIKIIGIKGVTDIYDVTMMGYFLGSVFMFVAIVHYDLLGMREIAKEYVIDRISEGIIATDNDGFIHYYNEPAKKLYPEIIRVQAKIPEEIKEAVSSENSIKKDGRIYVPEDNSLFFHDKKFGTLYAIVDETEHFKYMEELEKQKAIADSANEAKSRFLANMSHEIRTPINAVLGMDEMIMREAEDAGIRSYAADIQSAGRTLLSLINDILDFSKVEEGKMEIIPVQYELSSLINDLVNMTRERAEKKGLLFKVEVDKEIPHLLKGDEIRIKQCALNLLSNAVKYTEEGFVKLAITFENINDLSIALRITVSDTGIGMKQEDLDKLFSHYARIEEERNRTIEGTGLGMSITKALVGLMGSKVEVKSTYGKGSEFSFAIEQEVINRDEIGDYASKLEELRSGGYTYHEMFHAPDANILVVDDTEMNLRVIENLLKKTEIGIDTALSGREALTLAENKKYDVIFIDHMMPDMDGITTLSHIRKNSQNIDTPAVALTANAVSGARAMYLNAGFNDYLSKPIFGEKLERMLMALIPKNKWEEYKPDEEDAPQREEEEEELPEWLKDIPEIEYEAGLGNCGNPESYISVLSIFKQTADYKAREIEDLYADGDIQNYTIKVHALKSSARIIGAMELSRLAENLEAAGKGENLEYIKEHTDRLISMYRDIENKLSPLDEGKEDLPPISDAAMKDAYNSIIEVAGSMDYQMMEGLLKDIRGYALPKVHDDNIKEVEKDLLQLDWDAIRQVAEKGLSV